MNFEFILGLDCETTGVCVKNNDPLYNKKTKEKHQALSWGFLVIDALTYKVIEKLYLEVKWNEESIQQKEKDPEFGQYAVNIHGLSQDYLDVNGVDEEEAVRQIANLIIKYWGTSSPLNCLGHNVHFDIRFLQDVFERHELTLRFSQRHVDSFSLAHPLWNAHNSDELFNLLVGTERKDHNALEDIEMTLESIKVTRDLFTKFLSENNIERL